jgi:hypothetical protein
MQDSPIDRALFYRGDIGKTGLLKRDGGYKKPAYAFKATGAMLDTPQRLAVLAGRSANDKTVQVLISNYEIPESHRNRPRPSVAGGPPPRTDIQYQNNRGYRLKVQHLPWGDGKSIVVRYRTSSTENSAETRSIGEGDTLEISNPLPPPGIELIVIQEQ